MYSINEWILHQNVRVELDLSNHATEADLNKKTTGMIH